MKNEDLAKKILEIIGKNNIIYLTHCATRIRLNVKDEEIIDLKALDRLNGVIKAQFNGGQLQIIIGAKVKSIFNELNEIVDLNQESIEIKKVKNKKNLISKPLEALAGVFGPTIPVLIGCGMIKSIASILLTMNLVNKTSDVYQVFIMVGDLIFYFFPFFLAVSAAKKFKTNEYLAVALAGAYMYPLIMNGALNTIKTGVTSLNFLGFPILFVNYKSTIIPIIISVWIMSYVYNFLDKKIPDAAKVLFLPMSVLFIMVPLQLIAIGPFGIYMGKGVANIVTYLYTTNGVIGSFIFGTFRPVLILFGMHYAITPINAQLISEYGYSVISPANLTGNLAQAGACLAIFLLLKNKEKKSGALTSGITALFGITEPAIFGFNLKYKKPFICAMVAGGIGAAYINFWGGGSTAIILPGLLALPTYIAKNYIHILIGITISITLAISITMLIGIEEEIVKDNNFKENSIEKKNIMVNSPINGTVKALSEVDDPAFSKKMLGDGIAIEPEEGKVYAPFDGVVASLFPTNHAIGLLSNEGVEALIHVGIDTVKLNGQHFKAHIGQNQKVKKGDLLIEFDKEAIKKAGYAIITPFIISNTDDYSKIDKIKTEKITVKEAILSIQA